MSSLKPLLVADVLQWGADNLLGIGVSTTVIVLALIALEGRKLLTAGRTAGSVVRTALVSAGLIAALLALGVITGLDVDRAVELAAMAWDLLAGFL